MQQHALGKNVTLQSEEKRIVQHFAAAEPLSTLLPTPQWKNYAALLHGMAMNRRSGLPSKGNGSMAACALGCAASAGGMHARVRENG